jgi:hypothetical protein
MRLTIPSIIRTLLVLSVAICVFALVWLRSGIQIESLHIGSLKIEKLYLKLDKKLICRADLIVLPRQKTKAPIPDLNKALPILKQILYLFETIALQDIYYDNDRYALYYIDRVLYMQNEEYEIAITQLEEVDGAVQAQISHLYIKQYGIGIHGSLRYDEKRSKAHIKGIAKHGDIHCEFSIDKKRDRVTITAQSNQFRALASLIDQFEINPKIKPWIVGKTHAGLYRLKSFRAIATLSSAGFILDPRSLQAELELSNASLRFKRALNPVKAKKVKILYDDGVLYILPQDPYYASHSLKGSQVAITQLGSSKTDHLHLSILLDAPLDKDLHQILEAYHIRLPLKQSKGSTESRVRLDINLKSKQTEFSGDFKIGKSEVQIAEIPFAITGGSVSVRDGIATLTDLRLQEEWYDLTAEGTIDLHKKWVNLQLDLHKLQIGDNEKGGMSLPPMVMSATIDYRDQVDIELPQLQTSLTIHPSTKALKATIKDLNPITTKADHLPIPIDGGTLVLKTQDYHTFAFTGELERNSCFFYLGDAVCMTRIPVQGNITDKGFTIDAFEGRLQYDSARSRIRLDAINFDLKKFFESQMETLVKGNMVARRQLSLNARNSTLRYGQYQLKTDSSKLLIRPSGDFVFNGTLGPDRVRIAKKKTQLTIEANAIHDRMLHPLINFEGLQEGRYSVNISGDPNTKMQGKITLQGGVMRDFKAYNNLIAFINTIPALATLNSPGFNPKGFKIKEGVIDFSILEARQLRFDRILVEGSSATISGEGSVDLDTGAVDILLAIHTAREMGKVVGSIPLVGYILLGKDRSITTGLHISGTLENPVVETSPIKDILLAPFRIIERTIAPDISPPKNLDPRKNDDIGQDDAPEVDIDSIDLF